MHADQGRTQLEGMGSETRYVESRSERRSEATSGKSTRKKGRVMFKRNQVDQLDCIRAEVKVGQKGNRKLTK